MTREEAERRWTEAELRAEIKRLEADNKRLRAALINMLDDGDETDRTQARRALEPKS